MAEAISGFNFKAAANATGMKEKQLRNWLDRSLVRLTAEKNRSEGNWRIFPVTDIMKLAVVARLYLYGVPLDVADSIYECMLDYQVKSMLTRDFGRSHLGALMGALEPVKIGIRHAYGDDEFYWWKHDSSRFPVLKIGEDRPDDFAIIPLGTIASSVITRLFPAADVPAPKKTVTRLPAKASGRAKLHHGKRHAR